MSYDYPTGTSKDPQGSTTDTAKDQASSVAHSATQSGQQLAGEAKGEAAEVGREAGRQAKSVLRQGRDQVSQTASDQQQKAAGGLRSIGEELSSMAQSSEQGGLASNLAEQAGSQITSIAGWLENREPAELLEEVKRFARNRPGLFLGIAAGAGLLAGRLTRGMKDASSDDGSSTGAPQRTSAYGSGGSATYGTGAVYGGTTSSGTGAAYAAGAGAMTGGETTTSPLSGTAGGAPTYGVEGGSAGYTTSGADADDTIAYSTGGADADAYTTDTYGSEGADLAYAPDTYGTGVEDPEGTGTTGATGGGIYGGGAGEVPERGSEKR